MVCFDFEIINLSEIFGFWLFIIPTPFRDSIWALHFLELTLQPTSLMWNYRCVLNKLVTNVFSSHLAFKFQYCSSFLRILKLKSPKKLEFTLKVSLSHYSWNGYTFLFSLTKFIDSAKKLKRPLKEMPLSHLRKVINYLFFLKISRSLSRPLLVMGCVTSNPEADIKLFCCLFAVTFFFPWEKLPFPLFAKHYPFCNFRSIFVSPLLPEEDWKKNRNKHWFLSV